MTTGTLDPGAPEPRLTLTAEEAAAALLNDDAVALRALRFDVRHIVTFVTQNRTEQVEALTTLRDAAADNRLFGAAFWDEATQCGCAIGTICHAIGIDPDEQMPEDHPRVARHRWLDENHQWRSAPATWGRAIRNASGETLAAHHGDDATLFVEALLYPSCANGYVWSALHDLFSTVQRPDDGYAIDPIDWALAPESSPYRYAQRHANETATARARDLLAQVAQELLDEVNALPEGAALAALDAATA